MRYNFKLLFLKCCHNSRKILKENYKKNLDRRKTQRNEEASMGRHTNFKSKVSEEEPDDLTFKTADVILPSVFAE